MRVMIGQAAVRRSEGAVGRKIPGRKFQQDFPPSIENPCLQKQINLTPELERGSIPGRMATLRYSCANKERTRRGKFIIRRRERLNFRVTQSSH
jgi:hypothetical protein